MKNKLGMEEETLNEQKQEEIVQVFSKPTKKGITN